MVARLSLEGKCVPKLSLGTRKKLGNEKKVAAGFSLRPHRRDACATKDYT